MIKFLNNVRFVLINFQVDSMWYYDYHLRNRPNSQFDFEFGKLSWTYPPCSTPIPAGCIQLRAAWWKLWAEANWVLPRGSSFNAVTGFRTGCKALSWWWWWWWRPNIILSYYSRFKLIFFLLLFWQVFDKMSYSMMYQQIKYLKKLKNIVRLNQYIKDFLSQFFDAVQ